MSSGEQQRVKMIRVFLLIRMYSLKLTDKCVYLLDEATSNMDAEMERIVLTELKRLQTKHKVSVLFISHNPHTMNYADQFLSIDSKGQLQLQDKCKTITQLNT